MNENMAREVSDNRKTTRYSDVLRSDSLYPNGVGISGVGVCTMITPVDIVAVVLGCFIGMLIYDVTKYIITKRKENL
jgi:uncharacterized membrane protein YjjP (DUF1212 family)